MPERRPTRGPKPKRRGLWDSAEIERRKRVIARIAKSERPPSEYRISDFVNDSGHRYIDVRLYKGRGRPVPTGTGLPIHVDKLPDVIEALRDALRREAKPGRAARQEPARESWPAVAEASAPNGGGGGQTGVGGSLDVDDGWGAWRQRW